jgi:hypothetical protein
MAFLVDRFLLHIYGHLYDCNWLCRTRSHIICYSLVTRWPYSMALNETPNSKAALMKQ